MKSTRDFVATAYVVKDAKTLLILHKKLGLWLPPGGHIEQDELPCDAVIREVEEETGLKIKLFGNSTPVYDAGKPELKDVEMLAMPNHIQLEHIEPGHQHIDLVYIAKVIGGEENHRQEEADDMKWFSNEDLDREEISENVRHYGKIAISKVENLEVE